ncbi:MAG: 1,4-dihydroxy-2-naphthoate octaprenyltransferase [Rhodospirillaceae bacterium]|nr:1,4-dihydroxy-2-naphthoate octaprenyltransferase [Rhodospirillaceae bacterium]
MGEPSAAILNQPGTATTLKRWALATRPAFLSASIFPVMAGSAWGYGRSGSFDLLAFVLAIIATALAHGGVNVFNDVYDEKNGTDGINAERIFPFSGGSRFIQNNIMDIGEMARLGWGLLVLALLFGLWLAMLKGWVIIALGGFGVFLGVVYSAPPLALASRGLGEIAVGIGFGPIAVMGAVWLQGAEIETGAVVISIIIGLWVALVLINNEIPDINADKKAGKKTLAVRLGQKNTAWLYFALHFLAMVLVGYLAYGEMMKPYALGIVLFLLPASFNATRLIYSSADDGKSIAVEKITIAIKSTLAIQAIGSIWLALFAII